MTGRRLTRVPLVPARRDPWHAYGPISDRALRRAMRLPMTEVDDRCDTCVNARTCSMGVKMSQTVSGMLELLDNAGGCLRIPDRNYRPQRDDVFVTPALCRSLRLRGGEIVVGTVRRPSVKRGRAGAARPELRAAESINGRSVDDHLEATPFEELTAIVPEEPIRLESPEGSESMRVVDLLTPFGFGQRGLVVAPPRTGKSVLLQQMADGLATNHPDA